MKADNSHSNNNELAPLILAGPCSAESEEQVIQTARAIKQHTTATVFRAGVWKPRTNPGGFEGIGLIGLSWLLQAKKETGLKTAVEVATAEHVNNALQFDTDVLWIGARTTVNPFSVQEIADALKGTDKLVLVKNPINPDAKLWIGAIERLRKVGIENIGLIHRGFSSYVKGKYRNAPMWQIPIEMKRLYPEIPMIVDPSHICGNRFDLQDIAQKGLNLGYQGLMIESHIDPNAAWTDKEQQVTPRELQLLLEGLIWKKHQADEQFSQQIDTLREQINLFDDELIQLLTNRLATAQQIGNLKKENNVAVLQSNRWNEILTSMIEKGTSVGLNDQFIQAFMEIIHLESIRLQSNMNQSGTD
jgi:chorismate mutase